MFLRVISAIAFLCTSFNGVSDDLLEFGLLLKNFEKALRLFDQVCPADANPSRLSYLKEHFEVDCHSEKKRMAYIYQALRESYEQKFIYVCRDGTPIGVADKDLSGFITNYSEAMSRTQKSHLTHYFVGPTIGDPLAFERMRQEHPILKRVIEGVSVSMGSPEVTRRRDLLRNSGKREAKHKSIDQMMEANITNLRKNLVNFRRDSLDNLQAHSDDILAYKSARKEILGLLGKDLSSDFNRRNSAIISFRRNSLTQRRNSVTDISENFFGSPNLKGRIELDGLLGAEGKIYRQFRELQKREHKTTTWIKIQNLYTTYREEVGNKDKRELKDIKGQIGRTMIDLAVCKAVKKTGFLVIARSINLLSYPLIADGSYTKNMHIKGKSADFGLMAGLVPYDQKRSKLRSMAELTDAQIALKKQTIAKFQDYNNKAIALGLAQKRPLRKFVSEGVFKIGIERKGEEIYISESELQPGDEILYVMDYPDVEGKGMAADLDLFEVAPQEPIPYIPSKNPEQVGNMYQHEEGLMDIVNTEFNKLLAERPRVVEEEGATPKPRKIVHHGAENNWANSSAETIDFPLHAYIPPNCHKVTIGIRQTGTTKYDREKSLRQLKEFYNYHRRAGFKLFPNKEWNWQPVDALGRPVDPPSNNPEERTGQDALIDRWVGTEF